MKLSVVIPAYNRHELTVRHVEECLKSTRFPDEIIVVNDGGPAYLRGLLMNLSVDRKSGTGGAVPIIYANITEDILWNYNGACNLGLFISTGEVIALEDTDHIPARNTYEKGLTALANNPLCDRVAFTRRIVQIAEMGGPMEEWKDRGKMGPNQMVGFLKREAWVKLKGQDERFARHYGFMAYDLPYRRDKVLGFNTVKESYYWAVLGDGGEPGLKRGLSAHNRRLYHENANRTERDGQYDGGLLNFNYTVEKL